MFHLITGSLSKAGEFHYISNDFFGIQAEYAGTQQSWTYHLFPILDDHNKSIYYFAWDSPESKWLFLKLLKMGGVGPKTAYTISLLDYTQLQQAIESMDIGFFQKVPWIGPKTAKRLVIELKSVLKKDDLLKISWDDKAVKDIIKYCKSLGYDPDTVKQELSKYPGAIRKETTPEVVKWLISKL